VLTRSSLPMQMDLLQRVIYLYIFLNMEKVGLCFLSMPVTSIVKCGISRLTSSANITELSFSICLIMGAAKRLAGFTKSTLLIEADADVPIIHDNATYIHQHIKNSRLVTVHGSAHMINLEKPGEFNKVVLSFLREKN
jgi:pimeloyl-ACP methyl ester carboxylesterase